MENGEIKQLIAVPALVVKGPRQNISSLFINIRAHHRKEKDTLARAVTNIIYANNGIIAKSNEGILAFFNLISRHFQHEVEAIKAAVEIRKYNADNTRLEVGIGIHSGDVIVTAPVGDKIGYTCLGNNVISMAKKLAMNSKNEILISEEVFKKTTGNVRTSRVRKDEIKEEIYAVNNVFERERYSEYVERVMERIGEDDKTVPRKK